jgi:hypothetical protein
VCPDLTTGGAGVIAKFIGSSVSTPPRRRPQTNNADGTQHCLANAQHHAMAQDPGPDGAPEFGLPDEVGRTSSWITDLAHHRLMESGIAQST